MPNVISADRRSVTYIEDISVFELLQKLAEEREISVATILREATAAYSEQLEVIPTLFASRAAAKASERAETERQIALGELSPEAAQARNAPITQPVKIANLWAAIRRHARSRSKN